MAVTTITPITTVRMVEFTTGMVITGMLGCPTIRLELGHTYRHMDTKSQTVIILTMSLQAMGITIVWFTTVLLVGMMVMCMPTLGCHIIAIHMDTTLVRMPITTITQQRVPILMLLHTMQEVQEEGMTALTQALAHLQELHQTVLLVHQVLLVLRAQLVTLEEGAAVEQY